MQHVSFLHSCGFVTGDNLQITEFTQFYRIAKSIREPASLKAERAYGTDSPRWMSINFAKPYISTSPVHIWTSLSDKNRS